MALSRTNLNRTREGMWAGGPGGTKDPGLCSHGAVGRTETHVKQSQRMSWAISSRFTSVSSVGRVPPCGEKETLGPAGERFLLLYSRLGSHISRLGSIKSYLILVGPHEEVQCSAHQAGFVIGCDGVVHRKAEQWLPW